MNVHPKVCTTHNYVHTYTHNTYISEEHSKKDKSIVGKFELPVTEKLLLSSFCECFETKYNKLIL